MKTHSLCWPITFRALGMGTGWWEGDRRKCFSIFPDTQSTQARAWKIGKAGSAYCSLFLTFAFSWCNSDSHMTFLSCCLFRVVLASNCLTPLSLDQMPQWGLYENMSRKKGTGSSIHTSPVFSLLLYLLYTQFLTQMSKWHKGSEAVWGPEVMNLGSMHEDIWGQQPRALEAASLHCFSGIIFPSNHLLSSKFLYFNTYKCSQSFLWGSW